jgi:hypothetical protein
MVDVIDIDTIRADIGACQARVKELQHQTVEYVAFQPSGKIIVTDKPSLESTNNEIDRLQQLSTHNADVLSKLTASLGEYATVEAVRVKKHQLQDQIKKTELLFKQDLGRLIEREHNIDPEKPFENAKAATLKGKRDETFAILRPMLTEVTEQQQKADVILAEYKPSGLDSNPLDRDQFKAITRADVAALGA